MKKIYWNNTPNYKQLIIEKYGSPNYSFVKKGPDHDPIFSVTVKVIHKGSEKQFTAESNIKKEAEKLAAKGLLELDTSLSGISNEVLHEYSSILAHTEDTELENTFEKIVLSPNNASTYGGVRVSEPKPKQVSHIRFVTDAESDIIVLVDIYSLPNFCKEMLVPKTDREIKLCMTEVRNVYTLIYYIGYYTGLNKYVIAATGSSNIHGIINTLPSKINVVPTVECLIQLIQ